MISPFVALKHQFLQLIATYKSCFAKVHVFAPYSASKPPPSYATMPSTSFSTPTVDNSLSILLTAFSDFIFFIVSIKSFFFYIIQECSETVIKIIISISDRFIIRMQIPVSLDLAQIWPQDTSEIFQVPQHSKHNFSTSLSS